jgi:hypothetical protein
MKKSTIEICFTGKKAKDSYSSEIAMMKENLKNLFVKMEGLDDLEIYKLWILQRRKQKKNK